MARTAWDLGHMIEMLPQELGLQTFENVYHAMHPFWFRSRREKKQIELTTPDIVAPIPDCRRDFLQYQKEQLRH